ncbi:MAG TPA: hypothetical protein VFN97_01660 [Actinospica sp.]|nr:hypothetical protein [Actinospica sp.]
MISATGQITRPVNAYLPSPGQVHTLLNAANTLQARCMRSFGLTAPQSQTADLERMPKALEAASPLYGFFNTTTPAALGYNRVVEPPAGLS